MNLVVITPIFGSSAGGASAYYNLLTRHVLHSGSVDFVSIFCEKAQNHEITTTNENDRCAIHNVFPSRAAGEAFGIRYLLLLFFQNLIALKLMWDRRLSTCDLVLVHSSFFNLPNFLFFSLLRFRAKTIVDVRDAQLSGLLKYQLIFFPKIIACSESASQNISSIPGLSRRLVRINVPLDLNELEKTSEVLLDRRGGKVHIAVVGLVKERKGTHRILEAFSGLREDEYCLHVIGAIKNQSLKESYCNLSNIYFYGALPHEETLSFLKSCDLLVNASMSEGLPRSVLEAMYFGTRVLVPACVGEFRCFPDSDVIFDSDGQLEIKKKIVDICQAPRQSYYGIERHFMRELEPEYLKVFREVYGES